MYLVFSEVADLKCEKTKKRLWTSQQAEKIVANYIQKLPVNSGAVVTRFLFFFIFS